MMNFLPPNFFYFKKKEEKKIRNLFLFHFNRCLVMKFASSHKLSQNRCSGDILFGDRRKIGEKLE